MQLLQRVRVEVYIPDLPTRSYQNLVFSFEEEFTYSFEGCTVVSGLNGSYLSNEGVKTDDRINVIYTDVPIALTTDFTIVARYARELKQAASEALAEESVLIAVIQVFHST